MASRTKAGGLFKKVCRWLSANWTIKPAISQSAAPGADATERAAPAAPVTDFGLSSRLAAVARHNLPSSRPARQVKASRYPMPAAKPTTAKSYKDTRLPTTFAVSALSKPARASAEIISLDAARRSRTNRNIRVAA